MRQLKRFLEAVEGKRLFAGTAGACAALFILFLIFVHQPLMASRAAEQAKAQQNEMLYMRVANFKNAHIGEERPEAALEARKKQADENLPETMQQGEFLATLQRTASDNGIHIREIKPGKLEEREGYASLPITLTVQADYFSLLDFLRNLEKLNRFVSMSDFSVTQEKGNLRCTMKFSIYASRLDKKD